MKSINAVYFPLQDKTFFHLIFESLVFLGWPQTVGDELTYQTVMLLFSVITIQGDTGHIIMVMARVCM